VASYRGYRRFWFVAVGSAAALAGIVAGPVISASGRSHLAPVLVAPLGVNVAPWDSVYTGQGGAEVIQPLLKAAGVDQLRYGGGSYADYYDWQTNTNIGNCLPGDATASFTSGCASGDPLSFGDFSQEARAIGARSFVTVNYGSGTPALAAAWVTQARTEDSEVALWELGNENYGCWEVNNALTGPPANITGYQPSMGNTPGQDCPQTLLGPDAGTQALATSYAVNALPFMQAMKAADPTVKIGVPWAFDTSVTGSGVPNNTAWNNTVLAAVGSYVSFVDAHYYPFDFSGDTGSGDNPTDEEVLRALQGIPALARAIRSSINSHNIAAQYLIGETSVSNSQTTTACTPAGAVFAAGDVLSWLAAGAASVDWWDMNNYGNTGTDCTDPDFGLFTSSASSPATETAYYGYLLASALARPGARVGTLATSDPADVLGFQASLPSDKHTVAFINLDTSAARTVTFHTPEGLSGTLETSTYSAGQQNATNSQIVAGSTSASTASAGLQLPPESITILST
jgi:hypothetical protein